MPTPMDAMLGLVVSAIGLLILVIGFSIQESKKRWMSYGISSLVIVLGFYYYVSSEMRSFEMRKRISNLQRQQQTNLDEIQKRLQENVRSSGKMENSSNESSVSKK